MNPITNQSNQITTIIVRLDTFIYLCIWLYGNFEEYFTYMHKTVASILVGENRVELRGTHNPSAGCCQTFPC